MLIRAFKQADFDAVQDIYQGGIDSNNATFQLEKKNWQQWQASMLSDTLLVVVEDDRHGVEQILAWAGLSAVSTRDVYCGVAEVSIYVAKSAAGRGVGTILMEGLIVLSERLGFWTLQAAIFPENSASIALHTRFDFARLGRRKALGKMHGQWRDVDLFERRSTIIGV
ncbi:MAG: N-acetyltransferase family protein [Oceanospirillaceae bacterium]|nr:N-acetyltransferase family protein [Oceanospirillaceae bacterium]